MRTHLLIFGMLSLLLLGSCKGKNPLAKNATGLTYEVVVTMEPALWNGAVGEALRADLQSDVRGLSQSEPSMRITYATPNQFNGLLTYVRNIFILNINPSGFTQPSVKVEKDRWANGQVVVTLNAPTAEEALEYMNTHPRVFENYYSSVEVKRAVELQEKRFNVLINDTLTHLFGVSLKVPDEMRYTRAEKDFFWMSNNAGSGRMDMVVYTFPYRDTNTFTAEYLIAKRDSVMKINMPGSFPNSYMATEMKYVYPEYSAITVNGKYNAVLRGLWRVQGDMMGGPFVSHARLDEVNNRVVVAEGFVYAPETDKRKYIRRLEAALFTLRLPGETEQLPEIVVIPSALEEKE